MSGLKNNTVDIVSELLKELNPVLESFYNNSVGHGIKHVTDVMYRALHYNEILNLKLNKKEIVLSSLLHDMYSESSRKTHHILGCEYVMKSTSKVFDGIDKERVAKAILEHRASYNGEYSSLLSELISSADRGEPNLTEIVNRCYISTKEFHPEYNVDEINNAVKKHLSEKFTRNGYAKYPNIYLQVLKKRLDIFHDEVEEFLNGERLVIIEDNGTIISLGLLPYNKDNLIKKKEVK